MSTAKIKITADPSILPAGISRAVNLLEGFAKKGKAILSTMKLAPGNNKKSMGQWTQAAMGHVVGQGVTRGIDALIAQGQEIFDFEEQLMRFGIVAHYNAQKLGEVRTSIREVAQETGLGANLILQGSRAYADMAGASAFTNAKMRIMARTAQASETDIKTLSEVMFQLQHSMKVPDSQLEETLGGIIETSKEGAVHFSSMAKEINELAPQAARYGMVGREGVNQLTALMQVARTGFGSVSEMGTGITRVFSGLTMHAKEFREYGVDIFNTAPDGTKTWKHFSQIFEAIRKHNVLSKNPELLRKAFGRSEADRTFRLWMEGVDKLKEFEKAGMAAGVVTRDLNTVIQSTSGRLSIAVEKMKTGLAEAFTPERIERFTQGIESMVSAVGTLADVTGKVVDGFGAIYDLGAGIRRWQDKGSEYDPDDMSEKDFEAYKKAIGLWESKEARAYLEDDMLRAKRLKGTVEEKMSNGKTTKESDKAAIRELLLSKPGSITNDAALSYLLESKMPPGKQREIEAELQKEKGWSFAQKDMNTYESMRREGQGASNWNQPMQFQQWAGFGGMMKFMADVGVIAQEMRTGRHRAGTSSPMRIPYGNGVRGIGLAFDDPNFATSMTSLRRK